MRLLTFFIIAICIASCSSELIDTQEPEYQIKQMVLDKGQQLRLVSQNVDDQTLESFLNQISSQLQESVEINPQEGHDKSNEIEFLPYSWLKDSYYWTNTSKKNITHQTYTTSYQNIQFPDQVMLLIVVRSIDKSNPVIPFFKWQYNADFGIGWKITCVKAQLIGPEAKISKTDIILEEEVRVFDKHMPCVFLPEPDLTLGWSYGG